MSIPFAFQFGKFRLLPGPRLLIADDAPLKLGGRAFDVLLALVERSARTVSKNELMDLVWPNLVVEENNLQVQMVTLRKLLGHRAVATVPGRGYRFTMHVVAEGEAHDVAIGRAATSANATSLQVPAGNLHLRAPALFGRDGDIAALGALLAGSQLVTVAGAGGIGKTLLAQAVAIRGRAHFPDGVWWIELATLSDGALVAATVARVLGIQVGIGHDVTRAIVDVVRSQTLLIVLDNCEHLLEPVARLIAAIRAESPDVRLLVTSQEVLKRGDESVYRIEPLDLPQGRDAHAIATSSAGALFVARATAADRRFVLSDANATAVAEICRHLDGIPLAIEFAAARLPSSGSKACATS